MIPRSRVSTFLLPCLLLVPAREALATITSLVPCLAVPCRVGIDKELPAGAITAGARDFTLRILGTDMLESEVVHWNGVLLPTNHIGEGEKQAVIRANMVAQQGVVTIELVGYNFLPFRIAAPPAIATPSPLGAGNVGTPYSALLTGVGGILPYAWSGTPPPGFMLSAGGLFTGTPTNSGAFTFEVRLTDAALVSVTKSFSLTITSGNAPLAVDDEYTTLADRPLQIGAPGVLLNDVDPSRRALTAVEPTYTGTGRVELQTNGSFTYTPRAGFTGTDSFTYRANNGVVSSNPATVRIGVRSGAPSCKLIPERATIFLGPFTTAFRLTVSVEVSVGGVPASGVPVGFQYVNFPGVSFSPCGPLVPCEFLATRNGTADFFIARSVGSLAEVGGDLVPISTRAEATVGGTTISCTGSIGFERYYLFSKDFDEYCLSSTILRVSLPPGNESTLAVLRRFRDQVLSRSETGREYSKQYYRFSPEVVRIGLRNPTLLFQARNALDRFLPLIQSIADGRPSNITRQDLSQIESLIRQIQAKAGPDLRSALAAIWDRINEPRFLAQFGIRSESSNAVVATAAGAYRDLPLGFESLDSGEYVVRGLGYGLRLTPEEAVLQRAGGAGNAPDLRMRLVGASRASRHSASDELPGRTHYLTGRDARTWRTNVRQFAKVRYETVYPGVDLVYYGNQGQMEFDFIVAPGGKPDRIRLSFPGAQRLDVDPNGDLLLDATGNLRLRKPVVYQTFAGVRREVEGRYRIRGNQVGFALASYDTARPLIIDPVLSYATYFGGGQHDFATAIAVDAAGNTYITGATLSSDLALRTPVQGTFTRGGIVGSDAFVTKLNPAGNAVIYSTYFGGGNDDIGLGIAVDAQGNAYVTGATRSADMPTVQPFQRAFGGAGSVFGTDAFVAKLNPAGSALVYSTYLGGTGDDGARGIAVDTAGNAYVAGATSSINFPTATPMQAANRGGLIYNSDAFVAKLNPAGSALVYSSYLGGAGDDGATGIAIDSGGNAYLSGVTFSANFPVVAPIQPTNRGSADAFVAKLASNGGALLYSTYLGGGGDDFGTGIALDAQGGAHLTGFTGSPDFPVVNAAQRTFGGRLDAFLTRLNPAGAALVSSTFLGGAGRDMAMALAVDAQGNAYVGGETDSRDFATPGAPQTTAGGLTDGFVAKLPASGGAFEYRSFHGGSGEDTVMGIAIDGAGNVYIAGSSGSVDSPATIGALQPVSRGGLEAVVSKLIAGTPPPSFASLSAASLRADTGLAAESIATGFGLGLAPELAVASSIPLPDSLAGTSVRVTDSAGTTLAAPLFAVSPGQINYLVPAGVRPGLAAVAVMRDGQVAASGTARIETVAPSVFSANSSGRGVAAALTLRVSANGARTTELLFRCGATAGSCTAIPIEPAAEGEQVFLLLFGTGIRGFTTPVTATIGGVSIPVAAAVPQGETPGLDQVNIGPLPRSLAGRGEVEIVLTVDGKRTNPVTTSLR